MNAVLLTIVIFTLTFMAVMFVGMAILGNRAARRKTLDARMRGYQSIPDEKGKWRFRDGLLAIGKFISHGNTRSSLREQFARTGYYDANTVFLFLGVKIILFAIALILTAGLITPLQISLSAKILIVCLAVTVSFFLPNLFIYIRRLHRYDEIRRNLPDAIDLMEICVSSGMGMETAWNLVSDEIRRISTSLADEMALTNLEIHLGSPRAAAMRNMADRSGVHDVASLATVLIQTEKFGTSVAEALRIFANSIREERSFRIEEKAEKAAVKLLFPMVLFIFPAVLIVVAGPAVITLVRLMGN